MFFVVVVSIQSSQVKHMKMLIRVLLIFFVPPPNKHGAKAAGLCLLFYVASMLNGDLPAPLLSVHVPFPFGS